ncbi:MAG: hypothetical protein H7Z41_16595 [Cytophagales bacterium]|nr:hypothetical protein [Armatimonadota bacterium]
MTKEQRLFYLTWAAAWPVLSLMVAIMTSPPAAHLGCLRDFGAWFVAFPAAWTVALLVVRHRKPLTTLLDHPNTRRLTWSAFWGVQAAFAWQRSGGEPHYPAARAIAIFLLVFIIGPPLVMVAIEAVRYLRGFRSGRT